jgi:hypothetical protein
MAWLPTGYNNTLTQYRAVPVTVTYSGDDAAISANQSATSNTTYSTYSYVVNGLSGPQFNPRVYSFVSSGGILNTVTESVFRGWVSLRPWSGPQANARVTVEQVTEHPVIEQIAAGASANYIQGAAYSYGKQVALIDAGAGDDTVAAGYYDFTFGNDGNDTIIGGAYAYGGAGDDTITGSVFLAGGSGDDDLTGQYEANTFEFHTDEAGWDKVQDIGGISLNEFARRAGFNYSQSSLAYGGKYSLAGQDVWRLYDELSQRLGGYSELMAYLRTGHTPTQISALVWALYKTGPQSAMRFRETLTLVCCAAHPTFTITSAMAITLGFTTLLMTWCMTLPRWACSFTVMTSI